MKGELVAPGNSSVSDLVFTYSVWFKEAGVPSGGSKQTLLTRGTTSNPSNPCTIEVDTDLNLTFRRSGNTSTALGNLRDPSAWYHLVVQSFGSGQGYIYINGVGQEMTNVLDTSTSQTLSIGARRSSPQVYFNGYMADIYFVEGTYPATTFGRYNKNGVWVPKDPGSLTYGANGFHLTFADPSDVGKDYSGNGNDFTATGFDTVPSTAWSRWLTCTGQGFHTQDTLSASAAFDWNNGNPNGVYALSLDNGATITFAPEIPVTYSSSLKVYVFGDNSTSVTLDGTTVSNVMAGAYAEFTGSGVISVDKPLTINGGTAQASLAVITIDEVPNGWTNGLYNTGGSDYDHDAGQPYSELVNR